MIKPYNIYFSHLVIVIWLLIYLPTNIGIVLVAINPYSELEIYGPDIVRAYRNKNQFGNLDPHVFAVAEEAFSKMERYRRSCTIFQSLKFFRILTWYMTNRHRESFEMSKDTFCYLFRKIFEILYIFFEIPWKKRNIYK